MSGFLLSSWGSGNLLRGLIIVGIVIGVVGVNRRESGSVDERVGEEGPSQSEIGRERTVSDGEEEDRESC